MLKTDWVLRAEFGIEALRKDAEQELQALERDFPHWPRDDARRCAIMRLATIFFVPVVSLYVMRIHMSDPVWWESYANGFGTVLADSGRTAFDKGIKGKLVLDLVGNLEHSFRLILKQFDPSNRDSNFKTICQSLLGATNPHLNKAPAGWEPTLELLRLVRNTVHNSGSHFPENRQNESVVFKDNTYSFAVGRPLDFISWDLLRDISEEVLIIVTNVVRDQKVVGLPVIKDFAAMALTSPTHRSSP